MNIFHFNTLEQLEPEGHKSHVQSLPYILKTSAFLNAKLGLDICPRKQLTFGDSSVGPTRVNLDH